MYRIPILLALLAVTATSHSILFAQTWSIPENVTDNVDIFDQKPSLDIGSAPFLSGEAAHIAYSRFDNKEIYYALKEFNRQPLSWNITQATNRQAVNAPNSENWDAALKVFEPSGRVYVAYRGNVSGSDAEIFLTNNINGAFNFNPSFITTNATDDWEPALFIHGSAPHIAYAGQGGTGAPPANQDDEIWYDDLQNKSQVSINSWVDRVPSLGLDAAGNAHIAFAGVGGGGTSMSDLEIWYGENSTGAWVVTPVTENGFEDTNPSLRIDTSGVVHISWQGNSEGDWDIYYANNASTTFSVIRVTAENTDEEVPSLAVDSAGYAHIAYQWLTGTLPDEEIYYTHNQSGSFTSQMGLQTLVSTGSSSDNLFPSLDIGSGGWLHLAFQGFDGNDTEVYYATTMPPVGVANEITLAVPLDYRLGPCFPNPFKLATTISYALPASGMVSLDIYDILGRHITNLVREVQPAGARQIQWDGRTQDGTEAGSGTYLARLRSGSTTKTITLTKVQ